MIDEMVLRDYCLSKKGASEGFPFGDEARVFKVMGKMFALIGVGVNPASISLKCDPMWASSLREEHPAITGAYHLNKTHWNGITSDGSVPDELMYEMIDHSYKLVVKSLTKVVRAELEKL
jgi:predicted DNA-binding protein (MmcQ/YjbR family)